MSICSKSNSGSGSGSGSKGTYMSLGSGSGSGSKGTYMSLGSGSGSGSCSKGSYMSVGSGSTSGSCSKGTYMSIGSGSAKPSYEYSKSFGLPISSQQLSHDKKIQSMNSLSFRQEIQNIVATKQCLYSIAILFFRDLVNITPDQLYELTSNDEVISEAIKNEMKLGLVTTEGGQTKFKDGGYCYCSCHSTKSDIGTFHKLY